MTIGSIACAQLCGGASVAKDMSEHSNDLNSFLGYVGGSVNGFIGSAGAFELRPATMGIGVPGIVASVREPTAKGEGVAKIVNRVVSCEIPV